MKMKIVIQYNPLDALMFIYMIALFAFADYPKIKIALTTLLFINVILHNLSLNKRQTKVNLRIQSQTWSFILIRAFWAFICLISTIWSPIPDGGRFIFSIVYRLMAMICILLYADSEDKLIKLIKYMAYGAAILCIRISIVVPVAAYGHARIGNYLSHDIDNSYGNTGVTYALGIISTLLIAEQPVVFKNKFFKYFLISVCTFFSLLSGSKKQFFFLLIAFLVINMSNKHLNAIILKKLFISLLMTVIAVFLIFRVPVLYNAIGYRLENFWGVLSGNHRAASEDFSTITRLAFLKEAIRVFIDHPIFGVGVDGFKYYNRIEFTWAECNYLEILADFGFIGFIVFYFPYYVIVNNISKKSKVNDRFTVFRRLFIVLFLFVDMTMVTYNDLLLQIYFATLYALCTVNDKQANTQSLEDVSVNSNDLLILRRYLSAKDSTQTINQDESKIHEHYSSDTSMKK